MVSSTNLKGEKFEVQQCKRPKFKGQKHKYQNCKGKKKKS